MKKIKLTQGKYALVDDEDFEYLSQWKWCAVKHRNNYYAKRNSGKTNKNIYMHRVIMKANNKELVDHKNHNTLDNQKYNLRICNNAQNIYNQLKQKNTSSKYKGVSWDKINKKWAVVITPSGRQFHLGRFKDEVIAAKIYDYRAKEVFGKFAKLNFENNLLTKQEYERLTSRKYSSKYIGVCWNKLAEKWTSDIRVNKNRIHFGYFKNEIKAAKTRDQYIIDNNLESKYKLNFKE